MSVTWVFLFNCLTLDLLCTAVLGAMFFMFVSALKLVYFSDLLGFKYDIWVKLNLYRF